jgi:predicted XRE-type DNA-binding protein
MEKLGYDSIFDAITEDAHEAADLQFRADLMLVLRGIFERRRWSQRDVMAVLDIPQPRVSDLVRGKVDKVSADKLIGYLAKLGVRFKPRLSTASHHKPGMIHCDVDDRTLV